MTLLHAQFHLRNQQAFRAALQADNVDRSNQHSAGLASSGGRSWSKSSPLSSSIPSNDVNARDWLGRTVLHLACASTDNSSLEYVRMLSNQPAINVNLCDAENHWTALHRALYNGNIPAALLLLQRADLDTSIKDFEGYTAFDLYNSSIEHSKPCSQGRPSAELYTWGTNRNATLGLGDGDDRTFPDQVTLMHQGLSLQSPISDRFIQLHASQIVMSKLHSAVVTSEEQGNVRLCGFSSGGRLGPGQHTQYSLSPLQQLPHKVLSVSLGQDHTLVLTDAGEVFSWGLNRFSQLGYVVEHTAHRRLEEAVQTTPRRILGPLRKDIAVCGVAACKAASACWTSHEVYTWGTNNGQLGYDKAAQPIQILPRKVTKLDQPVTSVVLTDFGMACLLECQDVMLFWNDRHFKINFPSQAFPAEITVYRPPQAVGDVRIVKVTSCDDNMAALSSNGELFTFHVPKPAEADSSTSKDRLVIKANKVWALRKQFSAVRDAALGADGSLVICTESGHVFVRSRTVKSIHSAGSSTGKTFKFQRIPYIQRVVAVCANETGAFGALRVDLNPRPIQVKGNSFAQDVATIKPFLPLEPVHCHSRSTLEVTDIEPKDAVDPEEDVEDDVLQKDTIAIQHLCRILQSQSQQQHDQRVPTLHGADMVIQTGDKPYTFPCHRLILSARCGSLHRILARTGKDNIISDANTDIHISLLSDGKSSPSLPRLVVKGCQPMTTLILLSYLYTDEVYALWDRRVSGTIAGQLKKINALPEDIRMDLQRLARTLQLPILSSALQSHVKTPVVPTMNQDMRIVYDDAQKHASEDDVKQKHIASPIQPDVILELQDRDVYCYSVVLRARSPLFHGFFGNEEWTRKRRSPHGVIKVNFKHLNWRTMDFVLRFLCCGQEDSLFNVLEFVHSTDELLIFMFDVIAAANELLLNRLVQIASSVILRHLTAYNACFILSDATHFNAKQLVKSVQEYIVVNLEQFLDNRLLEELPVSLVKQLSAFIHQEQANKSPQSRGNKMALQALEKHASWLAMQDIPTPIVSNNRQIRRKESAKLSPTRINRLSSFDSLSPSIKPQRSVRLQPPGDDIFLMEDADMVPPLSLDSSKRSRDNVSDNNAFPAKAPAQGWKEVTSVARLGMKEIMAQAARESNNTLLPTRASAAPETTSNSAQKAKQQSTRWDSQDSSEGFRTMSVGQATFSHTPSGSWRVPSTPTRPTAPSVAFGPTPSALSPAPQRPSPAVTPNKSTIGKVESSPTVVRATSSTQPGLGPVYMPTKQKHKQGSPDIRRVPSGGKAWSLPPPEPVASSSQAKSGISLIAIQQAQIEEKVVPQAAKRSLLDIQAEEHARREETDFLKWWEEEEKRVRMEAEANSTKGTTMQKNRSRNKGRAANRRLSMAPTEGQSPTPKVNPVSQKT